MTTPEDKQRRLEELRKEYQHAGGDDDSGDDTAPEDAAPARGKPVFPDDSSDDDEMEVATQPVATAERFAPVGAKEGRDKDIPKTRQAKQQPPAAAPKAKKGAPDSANSKSSVGVLPKRDPPTPAAVARKRAGTAPLDPKRAHEYALKADKGSSDSEGGNGKDSDDHNADLAHADAPTPASTPAQPTKQKPRGATAGSRTQANEPFASEDQHREYLATIVAGIQDDLCYYDPTKEGRKTTAAAAAKRQARSKEYLRDLIGSVADRISLDPHNRTNDDAIDEAIINSKDVKKQDMHQLATTLARSLNMQFPQRAGGRLRLAKKTGDDMFHPLRKSLNKKECVVIIRHIILGGMADDQDQQPPAAARPAKRDRNADAKAHRKPTAVVARDSIVKERKHAKSAIKQAAEERKLFQQLHAAVIPRTISHDAVAAGIYAFRNRDSGILSDMYLRLPVDLFGRNQQQLTDIRNQLGAAREERDFDRAHALEQELGDAAQAETIHRHQNELIKDAKRRAQGTSRNVKMPAGKHDGEGKADTRKAILDKAKLLLRHIDQGVFFAPDADRLPEATCKALLDEIFKTELDGDVVVQRIVKRKKASRAAAHRDGRTEVQRALDNRFGKILREDGLNKLAQLCERAKMDRTPILYTAGARDLMNRCFQAVVEREFMFGSFAAGNAVKKTVSGAHLSLVNRVQRREDPAADMPKPSDQLARDIADIQAARNEYAFRTKGLKTIAGQSRTLQPQALLELEHNAEKEQGDGFEDKPAHDKDLSPLFAHLYDAMPKSARMPHARLKVAAIKAGTHRITHAALQMGNVYAYQTFLALNKLALEVADVQLATRISEDHILRAAHALEIPLKDLPTMYSDLLRRDEQRNPVKAWGATDAAVNGSRNDFIGYLAQRMRAEIQGHCALQHGIDLVNKPPKKAHAQTKTAKTKTAKAKTAKTKHSAQDEQDASDSSDSDSSSSESGESSASEASDKGATSSDEDQPPAKTRRTHNKAKAIKPAKPAKVVPNAARSRKPAARKTHASPAKQPRKRQHAQSKARTTKAHTAKRQHPQSKEDDKNFRDILASEEDTEEEQPAKRVRTRKARTTNKPKTHTKRRVSPPDRLAPESGPESDSEEGSPIVA